MITTPYKKRYQQDPSVFGRVAVLCGGWSAEREVSLESGNAVFKALKASNINVEKIVLDQVDNQNNFIKRLLNNEFDRIFIALHGIGGEDGKVQALLDLLNIPYTGSDHAASAMAMNKLKAKQIWLQKDILTPDFIELSDDEDWETICNNLNRSIFVKPVLEGSSLGMSYVESAKNLETAYKKAKKHGTDVIAEQAVQGREFTVAILNNFALPPIELKTDHIFYDYNAKYIDETTEYICPVSLFDSEIEELKGISLSAFKELNCKGWARADFMRDEKGRFYLLEINTVPGMTSHSLVPMAAKEAGLIFDELVLEILMETFES